MLRILAVLIPVILIACSKDRPTPVAPAGKAVASQAPPAPTNLRFEALTDSSARVRWDASDEATDYDVNYKKAQGGRWTNEPHTGIRLYNTIYDLEPDTEYRWAVRAENSAGASEWVFGPNFTTSIDSGGGDQNQDGQGGHSAAADDSTTTDKETPLDKPTESKFSITLYWDDTCLPHCISAIEDAAAKWETVVIGDLQDGPLKGPNVSSNIPDDAIIDDIAIAVRIHDFDPYKGNAPIAFAWYDYESLRSPEQYSEDIGLPTFGAIYLPDILKYRVDENGNPIEVDSWRKEWRKQWEYYFINHLALHEIGHVLGLVPADDYSGVHGKFYGSRSINTWAQYAPAQLIRNYVPVSRSHWGNGEGLADIDQYILTNSVMSDLRIQHEDLFGTPIYLSSPNEFAADVIITDLDAAALLDLGYTVDMSKTEPLVVRLGDTVWGKANAHAWPMCGGVVTTNDLTSRVLGAD